MKATIPAGIEKALSITTDDKLEWTVCLIYGETVAIVRKVKPIAQETTKEGRVNE